MATASNPFEHHHHHHDDDATEPLDPAQESLADALRVSFFLLKIVMLGLLVWYMLSGLTNIHEQEVGVRLRFGNIVGQSAAEQVVRPGFALTWPYPIEQVLRVPTDERTLKLDSEFMFEIPVGQEHLPLNQIAMQQQGGLDPQRNSYVITGDASIMHLIWSVSYRIGGNPKNEKDFAQRVVQYASNVGDLEALDRIVRLAAQRGIVAFVAERTADELIDRLDDSEANRVRQLIQQGLDELSAGVQLNKVTLIQPLVPGNVHEVFFEVTSAKNEYTLSVEKARKYRNRILNEAAGSAHTALWRMIEQNEQARESGDEQRFEQAQTALAQAFQRLDTGADYGNLKISGEAHDIIKDAVAYRSRIIQQFKSEVARFESLYKQYREAPHVVKSRLWEKARAEALSGRLYKTITGDANIVISINPDPQLKKQWDKEDQQEKEEQAKEDAPYIEALQ